MNLKYFVTLFIISQCFSIVNAQVIQSADTNTLFWRYRLEPGIEMFYLVKEHSVYRDGESGRIGVLHVWVYKQNTDQSCRLIFFSKMSPYRIRPQNERDDYPAELNYGFCDLDPDGRIGIHWGLDNTYFSNLFIKLPPNQEKALLGWDSDELEFGDVDHYLFKPSVKTTDSFFINVSRTSHLDSIYEITNIGGLILQADNMIPLSRTNKYQRGTILSTDKTIKLDSIAVYDKIGFERFSSQLDIYFEADSAYDNLIARAEERPEKANEYLLRAESILINAQAKITSIELKETVSQWKNGFDSDSQYINETIRRRAEVKNSTSPSWSTEDFTGKNYSLKNFKGKVLLLDFWYKNCPWCIRSMPALKKLAQYFKDKPVIIIGMNVDKSEEDALFTIKTMKLDYLNLKARDISKLYGVTGYPTLFIIDKKGRIYDMHIGYSPDLYERLVKTIESALNR